jgi:hypothetical protein
MIGSRARSVALVLLLPLLLLLPSAASAATWSGAAPGYPPGISQHALQGVSCPVASVCTAPGHAFYTGTGTWGAFAETWNGSTWTAPSGVVPNNGQKNGILYGVHCPVETMCMMVGSYGTPNGQVAWAQRQVTSTWTMWNVGLPVGASRSELKDVWCTVESNWCMAVGWKMVSGDSKPWAVRFDTVGWPDTGAVSKSNAALNGVSCVSKSFCMAVGSTGSSPLAQVWNGTSWSVPASQPPVPGSWESAVLNSVHCLSTTWCMATGSLRRNEAGTVRWRPFADIWNGSSWTTTTGVPWGNNLEGLAFGISCRSTSECWIVGEGRSGSTLRPWAVRWTGSTWEIQSVPLVAGAEGAQLRDISCYATSSCKAVGWALFGGAKQALVETVTP